MWHAACIGHALAHIHTGVHYGSRHILGTHHVDGICKHCTHFCTTTISGSHVHSTTNSRTDTVAGSIKRFW